MIGPPDNLGRWVATSLRTPPSTSWKCGKPRPSIPRPSTANWGGRRASGFNSARVFLHHLPWRDDRQGFLRRVDQFLAIADRHHIQIMLVLLDAVWDPFPKSGPQREPEPGVHNSGWVQSPGVEILKHPARHDELKGYVKGMIGHFKGDGRILAWDLFNEPDNLNRPAYVAFEPPNKPELSLLLLRKVFAWAREAGPSQPLTAGVWVGHWGAADTLSPMDKYCLEQSDIITFHNYDPLDGMRQSVENLRRFHRPILCTEYMARPRRSIRSRAGLFAEPKSGAFNWGFCFRQDPNHLPLGFLGKNLHRRSAHLVPRHLPSGRHSVRPAGGGVKSSA